MKKITEMVTKKIVEMKQGMKNVKEKVQESNEKKEKIGIKPYLLLALMFVIAVVTAYLNISKYIDANKESYEVYNVDDVPTISTIYSEQTQLSTVSEGKKEKQEHITMESSIYQQTVDKIPPFNVITPYITDEVIYFENVGLWKAHLGVDITTETSDVYAFIAGIVKDIYYDACFGNTIVIQSNELDVKYCSLKNNICVQVGDYVEVGDVIGHIGQSAEYEKNMEPHLHLEVIKNHENISPSTIGIN